MYHQSKQLISQSENIVFFGGAGVSTQSGIPDFRSADGLYQESFAYPPETILSYSFFIGHTTEFYKFYREKMLFPDALPNKAHIALSHLENIGKLRAVITQNIDGLNQMAGSKQVYELHGSIQRNYCKKGRKYYHLDYVSSATNIPNYS